MSCYLKLATILLCKWLILQGVGGGGYTDPLWLLRPAQLPRYHPNVKKIVYLSLGSNLGDRQANLRNATGRLLELGDVLEVSSLYETEPVEVTDQPWFLNCAVAVRTELIPREFLAGILAIERSMGRQRTQPKGPRIIDIDILLFGAAHDQHTDVDGAASGDGRAEVCAGAVGGDRAGGEGPVAEEDRTRVVGCAAEGWSEGAENSTWLKQF